MFKRILTSVLGIPLLILIISLGGIPLLTSLIIIASIGLYELYKTYKITNKLFIIIEIILSIGLLIIMFQFQNLILAYLIIIFIFNFIYQLSTKHPSIENALLGFSGITYITLLIGHILLFDKILYGNYLVWLVFIIAWSTDTFAYFTGIYLGKHKLCPSISPKKTIEGSIGGIVGSLMICILYGKYLNIIHNINISLLHFIILGIITSIISQFGDLTASLIKRNYGVKDFGNIFPGHGGILDRFDSILFTAPIVYYYIDIII
jgi:phosphatidate cytidylyltransferase